MPCWSMWCMLSYLMPPPFLDSFDRNRIDVSGTDNYITITEVA